MEIVITAAAAAGIAAVVAWIVRGRSRVDRPSAPGPPTDPRKTRRREEAYAGAQHTAPAPAAGEPDLAHLREQVEVELRERRAEIVRPEERILQREESLETRLADLGRREQSLIDRERNAERLKEELREARHEHLREIERLAGLTQAQAKQILLRELE